VQVPVSCYTFGSPRVGNNAFVKEFNRIVDKAVRVVHRNDLVPTLPPAAVG
jgi:predicted lipase